MRVFMLVQPPGAQSPLPRHTSHLVSALRELGCTVVTHPWGSEEGDSFVARATQRARDVVSARRALRVRRCDVAVIKTSHDWRTLLRDIALVLAIRRHCRPVVLQLHGSRASSLVKPGHRLFKLATAALLALVDGIMVLSTEEQERWSTFRRRPPVFRVKNPYVPVPSCPGKARSSHRPCALFVGRLIPKKGALDIVKALPEVLEQTPCDLVIVGEGDQGADLRERAQRLGLEDRVTITGHLTGPELKARYEEAAIFILPTSCDEGFPTVIAEAMDAGLPIITSRIRGAADYLVPGENAVFVEPEDVKGLASAMITLLQDEDLREEMASANRERIRIFQPDLVAAEYLDVLQSLILRSQTPNASSVPSTGH